MHRRLAQSAVVAGYQRVGFGFQGCLCLVSLPVCVCLSGMQCKGPGVSWAPGPRGDASPAALAPNLALPPTPGGAPHCSTELVNHLSLARAAVSTVRYPTHTAVCCYPAALPPWPGVVHVHVHTQQPWEVEDTCKTGPLGEWREAKGEFMHRRPLQYIRPRTSPFAKPQTTDCSIEGRHHLFLCVDPFLLACC